MRAFLTRIASACFALIFLATQAHAGGAIRLKIKGTGGAPPAVTAPVLAAQTFPYGAWTQEGKAQVRLSATGLGLVQSTGGSAITGWQVDFGTCGNTSHWTRAGTAGAVTEGTAALTPTYAISNIATRKAAGDCTFLVRATNAAGTSNQVALTFDIDDNAFSIGDRFATDNFPSYWIGAPYSIAGFEGGTTSGQRKMLLLKGIDRGTSGLSLSQWTFGGVDSTYVTLQDADPAYPSQLNFLALNGSGGSNTAYVDINGLTVSSAGGTAASSGRFVLNGTNRIKLTNVRGGTGIDSFTLNTKCIVIDGASNTNIVVTAAQCLGQHGGLYADAASNLTIDGIKVRWFSERGLQFGSVTDVTVNDAIIVSPRRIPGSIVHIDAVQIDDRSQPVRLTFNRLFIAPMDAFNSTYQGFFYGGGADPQVIGYQPTDLTINSAFIAAGAPTGIGLSANGGAGVMRNITVVKLNTGVNDDCLTPEGNGACWTTAGATVGFGAAISGRWSGSLTVHHVMTDDLITSTGFATPTLTANTNKQLNHGSLSTCFADSTAKATLEAIPFATWLAMDLDAAVAIHKAAYAPLPAGCLQNPDTTYAGAFTTAGAWATN